MSTDDNLLDSDPSTMLAKADGLQDWSENKKEDFVKIFNQRVASARVILTWTARDICTIAQRRRFISEKHMGPLREEFGSNFDNCVPDWGYRGPGSFSDITGRNESDLKKVAEERAKMVVAELPPIKKAVEVIDKDTSKKIERCDELMKEAQAARDELEEVCVEIDMAELPEDMTIGAFRAEVKKRNKRRKELLTTMQECGEEGSRLEQAIAKKLYEGLPGLSDAVITVVVSHLERAVALGETGRRIEEQVKFGDSDAAMDILSTFESDEQEVSAELRGQLSDAMSTLKAEAKALGAAKRADKKPAKPAKKKAAKKAAKKKGRK